MGKDTDGEEVFPDLNSDEEIIIFGTTSTEDIPMKEIVKHTSFSSAQKGYHIRSDLEDRGYLEKKGWGKYEPGDRLTNEWDLSSGESNILGDIVSDLLPEETDGVLTSEQKGDSKRESDFGGFDIGEFTTGEEWDSYGQGQSSNYI